MGSGERVESTAASPYMARVYERVREVLASFPVDGAVEEALSSAFDAVPLIPPWFFLPISLDEAWRTHDAHDVPAPALEGILWGQYALFLHVRIHDDLLDGQRNDLRLVFAADRFLLESLDLFESLPGLNHEFRAFYLRCLRETVNGILEVARLESEPGRFQTDDLALHSRVCAIFKVGVAAVCHLYKRSADIGWLSALLDYVAVFSQIGDDVQDLAQDLEAGRFTWVGNMLLDIRPGESISRSELSSRLGEGLMLSNRGQVVIDELRRVARGAAAILPETAPGPVRDFVLRLGQQTSVLEEELHVARVRHVFGALAPSPG